MVESKQAVRLVKVCRAMDQMMLVKFNRIQKYVTMLHIDSWMPGISSLFFQHYTGSHYPFVKLKKCNRIMYP